MPDLTAQVREAAPSCPQCHGRRSEIRERVVVCSFCHGEGYVLTAAAVARALEEAHGWWADQCAMAADHDAFWNTVLAKLRGAPDA